MGVSAQEWANRYEAARRQAVQTRCPLESGWELALLARRGVVAWMRAWPAPEEPPRSRHHSGSPDDDSPAAGITISPSLCEQITSLLVSMILPQRSSQLESIS
jgi:hypothetical protein